ncbi:hypothetical protein BAUCODRAFT_294714 [Baudoinia panamericana UAMH 10762]|uniref:Uncharacterized protein n=1 Tax=Baudoinia panamericana (strain UAMH 10762) TaxID=717646 RepID=M2N0U2_BAUPA|nr:uncharacterized protein BAUCODRAFT_294714 [Baudoinia panamericana UAMH 10762]EMC92514.1 hypothetical protein BAUCODRAFT_294714 [Baudoinia panamericana UAMH 10762]
MMSTTTLTAVSTKWLTSTLANIMSTTASNLTTMLMSTTGVTTASTSALNPTTTCYPDAYGQTNCFDIVTPSTSWCTTMGCQWYAVTGTESTITTASLLPTVSAIPNSTAIQECLNARGGVFNGIVSPGCAAMLWHLEACYNSYGPITDPYNIPQSHLFQACACETYDNTPFNSSSWLWQNFTGCATCLEASSSGITMDILSQQLEDIDNFCRSQNPVMYLAIADFEQWLKLVLAGLTLTQPVLSGIITDNLKASSLFTTTPPLANLAYGPSAPFDGSLRGVVPNLMTQVLTSVGTGSASTSTTVVSITMLVDWESASIPPGSIGYYDPTAASIEAAEAASASLQSAISQLETVGQGGPTGPRCIGPCPKLSCSTRFVSSQVKIASVMVGLAIAVCLSL